MTSKEIAYQIITELVQRFEEQKLSYKKSDYNETLVRRDFIDPFFKSLGWDIDNSQGYAEAYREVIHEDRVKIGAATKAPDYSAIINFSEVMIISFASSFCKRGNQSLQTAVKNCT